MKKNTPKKQSFPERGWVRCKNQDQSCEVQRKLHYALGAVCGDWGWYDFAGKHTIIDALMIEWSPSSDSSWDEEKGYKKGDIIINWCTEYWDESPEYTVQQILQEDWPTPLTYEIY